MAHKDDTTDTTYAQALDINMEARIIRDQAVIAAADELAVRANAVFQSEYHKTSHIEGAWEYYRANMDTLAAYHAARKDADQ